MPAFSFCSLLDDLDARRALLALVEVQADGIRSHSYGDVADRARALARGLLAHGVQPGEPVGLFAPNGFGWMVARLGIAAAGAMAVAIDEQADAAEASGIVNDSGLSRLFTVRAHLPALAGLRRQRPLTLVLLDDPPPRQEQAEEGALDWTALLDGAGGELPTLAADAPAMLVYTSGTTGNPKAFRLSNANIEANVRAIGGTGLIGPGDRLLLPLPLHHVYPLVVGMLVPLSVGATVVLPEQPTGAKIVHALSAAEATLMIGVPRLYEAMVAGIEGQAKAKGALALALFRRLLALSIAARRRFGVSLGRTLFPQVHRRLGPKLRLLVSAGAKLDPAFIWTLEGLGFLTLSGYGLAETASAFTGNLPGARRIGSEGRPLFEGSEVRIADADAEGLGEIQLRGPTVFDGYLNNPEANRAAFTADGWFCTGDLGTLDADGFVSVFGRSKELIVLGGGKKVFPEELEKRYGASPLIREVAVIERNGALAALVLPDGAAIRASANASVEQVVRVELASVAKGLPSHERLSGFVLVREPLPRTRLGKYQRFLLPKLYEEALEGGSRREPEPLSAEDQALLAEPRAAAAWRVLEARYRARGLALDSDPQLDLGIDSLEWLSLGLELEAALGVRLAEQDLADAGSVRELLRRLQASPQAGEAAEAERAAAARLDADEAEWLQPTSGGERLAGAVLYGLAWGLAKLAFRLRVRGLEHLPAPPFVIVANHASDLDPPLLGASLPLATLQRLYWSGIRSRLFGSRLQRWFARATHIFPVDERAPGATLAMAGRVLDRGHSLVWFPESWRTPDGELQAFLPGIGRLLADHPVPAVPTYIDGTFAAMPRDRRFPRPHPVTITFGPPVSPEAAEQAGEGPDRYARIADGLLKEVAKLRTTPRDSP